MWRVTRAQLIDHIMLLQLSATLVTKQGVRRMDLKRVYLRDDSQRYVHFGSRWRSEMVRSCVNTWCDVIGNVETFESNFFIQSQQPICQYQWRSVETTESPVPHFCQFHVNNADMTIVMRHAFECVWSIYSHSSETGPEERLGRIGYFKFSNFSNTNLKIYFVMVHHTQARHLRNETWKCPKLNRNGVNTISSRYKLGLIFTARRL